MERDDNKNYKLEMQAEDLVDEATKTMDAKLQDLEMYKEDLMYSDEPDVKADIRDAISEVREEIKRLKKNTKDKLKSILSGLSGKSPYEVMKSIYDDRKGPYADGREKPFEDLIKLKDYSKKVLKEVLDSDVYKIDDKACPYCHGTGEFGPNGMWGDCEHCKGTGAKSEIDECKECNGECEKEIEEDKMNRFECGACHEEFSSKYPPEKCPHCGSNNIALKDEELEEAYEELEEDATVSGDIAVPDMKLGDKPQKRKKIAPDEYLGGVPVFMVELEDLLNSCRNRRTKGRYKIKNENVKQFLKETNYRSSFYVSNNGSYFRVK